MDNIAGPSRVPHLGRPPPQRERVESTYEEDLLGLLGQLSLDEMDEMQTFFMRRTAEGGPMSDHDVAMNDLLQQARALAVVNEDRALAERIAAGENDIGAVQLPPRPPNVIFQPNGNRAATQRNDNHQRRPLATVRTNTAQRQTWGRWFSSMVVSLVGMFDPAPGLASAPRHLSRPTSANTNSASAVPGTCNRPTGHECIICQDPIHGEEIRVPCGHYYDIECITDLFQSATKDETLFPPRCCRQNIPIALARPHLPRTLITTLQEKQVEFSTLKRVYCSSPACSRFLGPLSEAIFTSRVYTCPAPGCTRRTCGKCRGEHGGEWTHICRPDADTAQVLELSRASGWARCPGCSQVIELNVGCFHMTCRCRTEFCYLCLARWKTCQCPQWDERRLMAVAEERVDARLGQDRAARRVVGRNVFAAQPPVVPPHVPAPHAPRRPAENPPANATQQHAPGARPGPAPLGVPQVPNRGQWPAPTIPTPAPAPTTPQFHVRLPPPPPLRPPMASQPTRRNPIATPRSAASTSTPTSSSRRARPTSAATSVPAATTGGGTDVIRQRMVREMMERLRVDHDCNHERWLYRSGGGKCQSCGNHLRLYLFRCQGCEMLVCNRCRRNRL